MNAKYNIMRFTAISHIIPSTMYILSPACLNMSVNMATAFQYGAIYTQLKLKTQNILLKCDPL